MKTIEFTEFTLENDPQVYQLVYDFNALCDAEAETKENLLQYVFVIGRPSAIFITAAQQRAMLYALLKRGHPEVLLREAGELLSRDTRRVADAMARALGIDPKPEEPNSATGPNSEPQVA